MLESKVIKLVEINEDVYNRCLELGYSVNQSKIVGSKIKDVNDIEKIINSSLNDLPDLNILTDIDKGSKILQEHIKKGNHIALVTDSDMDGISSAYVLYKGLIETLNVDKKNITAIINRRVNGNGITEKLLKTVMVEHSKRKIDLVISGDHGSSNGISIGKMMDVGMDVIITDHHLVPAKDNAHNATAFINPHRDIDSPYRFTSGCAIAYFLIVNTKTMYEDLYPDTNDGLHRILPVVAASIIGDSMKLYDPINRAIVNAGLKELNSLREPIWQAFKYLGDITSLITEEILSFNFIPAINATNRMGEPDLGFKFYDSKDYRDAVINFETLIAMNDKRKALQKILIKDASLQVISPEEKSALTIVLEKGFGLNGIVSSNIGEKYFRPTMTFVKHDGTFNGSGRSINSNFDLYLAMTNINNIDKDIFLGFGGHKEACGCHVRLDKINDFRRLFNEEAERQLKNTNVNKEQLVIGEIDHQHLNESIVDDIRTIAPFGIGFEKIKYVGIFTIEKIWYIGRGGESVNIKLRTDTGESLDCFIWNSQGLFDHDILEVGKKVKVVYTPKLDTFRGNIEFKLAVVYMEET